METLHTFLQIDAVQDLGTIFTTLGTPGLLIASVYYVVREVKTQFDSRVGELKLQYDARISAIERRSEECEKDRVALRDMIIKRDHAA
jgi:hypothetical protein